MKQDKKAFTHRNVVNLVIVPEFDTFSRNLNTKFSLSNSLFGAVKLTKNADLNKYKFSGYSSGFNARSQFLLPFGKWNKNVVIRGADNSLSRHTDNNKKNILLLGERPTDGLEVTAITAEARYFVNISESRRKTCFTLHYNTANSFLC